MAGSEYYDHTTYPSQGAVGSSSAARAEFELIEAGFDKAPALAGNGGKLVAINAAGNAQEAITTTGTGSGVRATSPTLDSPTLTGTPSAPTAAAAVNTTQVATTAHVFAERANAATLTNKTLTNPVINGFSGTGNGAMTGNLIVTGALSATGALQTARSTGGILLTVVKFGNTLNGAVTDNLSIGNVGGGDLLLHANNAEQARIDLSGNFGLGVVPSAWGGNYKAFQMNAAGGGALASTNGGQTATQLSNGAYYNGTNWIYTYTGVGAARYEQTDASGGVHKWHNAPSGTAGNPITFTQAMTLDASGNLSNTGSHTIGSFTLATRPAHAAGKMIYVSDGGAGAVFQGSNGGAWVNLG